MKVAFEIKPEDFQKMEELSTLLGTPNVPTALYSAVQMMKRLYDYEEQGYKIAALDRSGKAHVIPLPKSGKAL